MSRRTGLGRATAPTTAAEELARASGARRQTTHNQTSAENRSFFSNLLEHARETGGAPTLRHGANRR